MKKEYFKLMSFFLSFALISQLLFGVQAKVLAQDDSTIQMVSQQDIDNSGGILTMQNNITYKLSQDITISNDFTFTTNDGYGVLELNGYKLTVASGAKLTMSNGVQVFSNDSGARDTNSAAIEVAGNFYDEGNTNIDLPYDTAIEVEQGGYAKISDGRIIVPATGILVTGGKCEVYGDTTIGIKSTDSGTGIKVGQAGEAVIYNYTEIDAKTKLDNSSGGKIYNFNGIVQSDKWQGGIAEGATVNLTYDDSSALNAANAVIKYTTDDSEPTADTTAELSNSNKTAAVTINDDTNIKFLAIVDGQTFELTPFYFIVGPTNQEEFMQYFNYFSAHGGDIYLGGDISFTGDVTLSSDNPVWIHTTGFRLYVSGAGNKLTIGKNVKIHGFGTNGSDTNYGVLAAANSGELDINSSDEIRCYKEGTAISVSDGGHATITNTYVVAQNQAVVANDNSKNAGTNVAISGGTVESYGDNGIAVNALNGASVSIDGATVNADAIISTGINVSDSASLTISGSTVVNAEGQNGTSNGVFVKSGATANISGGTINVDGEGANGVYVVSAKADISGNTVINANSDESYAVIGQKGGNLTMGGSAVLNSYGANGMGIFAVDASTADISGGNINVSGLYGIGAFAEASKVTMTGGKISLNGDCNIGLCSDSSGSNIAVSGTAEIDADGASDEGMAASAFGSITISGNAVINANTDDSLAAACHSSGNITVNDSAVLNSSGKNGRGIYLDGGATADVSGGNINVSGDGGIGIYADKQCNVNITGGNINVNVQDSSGIVANGENETDIATKIIMSGGTVNESGDNSIAVFSQDGAEIDIKGNANVIAGGSDSTGAITDGGSLYISETAVIDANGQNGFGINAMNGGKAYISGSANVNANGSYSTGAVTDGGSLYVSESAVINANGQNGIGTNSLRGGKIDISGSAIVNATGEGGTGLYTGTGGNTNISSGTVNAEEVGLNSSTESKDQPSVLTASDSAIVNMKPLETDNSGIGVLVSGEGATLSVGTLKIDAPANQTVDIHTPASGLSLEQYIPAASGNIPLEWDYSGYNGDAAGDYVVYGNADYPSGSNITGSICISQKVTVKYNDCDVNKDGSVDLKDLSTICSNYNMNSSSAGWKAEYDLNKDNTIDIYDLVKVSKLLNQ